MKSNTKAKKVVSPKGPTKRDLKVKELQTELVVTYGIESTTATVSELRKEIIAAKKAKKLKEKALKKSPISSSSNKREQKKLELFSELKALGGDLSSDKPVCDYTIAEIRLAIKALTPKKTKKGKKGKNTASKKSIVNKSQKDLIAELIGESVTPEEVKNDVSKVIVSPTEAVVEKPNQSPSNNSVELEVEDFEDDDLVIESDSSDDEEDDEAEFPGIERVNEFEHESRPGETLYKDEDANIWNDEQELVGVYNEEEDCIIEE